MNIDDVIQRLKQRASDRAVRTDYADRGCPEVAPPATADRVDAAEVKLGFPLYDVHRRALMEVGNGGFGPGDGLIGLPGGRLDDQDRSLIELRGALWMDATTAGLPHGVGADLFGAMFEREEHTMTNPLTKQPMAVQRLAKAIGVPYKPRS